MAARCDMFAEEIENQLEMRSFKLCPKTKYHPSNFTPDLVLKVINQYLTQLPYTSRDIILYNYPAADMRNQQEQ